MTITFFTHAPAKINLFLHVVGKRGDGMHLIESVFVFVKFSDKLKVVTDTDKSEIIFENCGDCIDKYDNTILRVINYFQKNLNINSNISVRIIKNIILSSGLGGGSADAAALINILGRTYNVNDDILNIIAATVGSDVPACLKSKTLFVSGVGEKLYDLSNLSLPKYILLVNPQNFGIRTAKIFKNYDKNINFSPSIADKLPDVSRKDLWLKIITNARNDLFDVSVKFSHEIKKIISCLEKLNGCILARMSGSGPSCFALFSCQDKADMAFKFMNSNFPQWWIRNTEIIE